MDEQQHRSLRRLYIDTPCLEEPSTSSAAAEISSVALQRHGAALHEQSRKGRLAVESLELLRSVEAARAASSVREQQLGTTLLRANIETRVAGLGDCRPDAGMPTEEDLGRWREDIMRSSVEPQRTRRAAPAVRRHPDGTSQTERVPTAVPPLPPVGRGPSSPRRIRGYAGRVQSARGPAAAYRRHDGAAAAPIAPLSARTAAVGHGYAAQGLRRRGDAVAASDAAAAVEPAASRRLFPKPPAQKPDVRRRRASLEKSWPTASRQMSVAAGGARQLGGYGRYGGGHHDGGRHDERDDASVPAAVDYSVWPAKPPTPPSQSREWRRAMRDALMAAGEAADEARYHEEGAMAAAADAIEVAAVRAVEAGRVATRVEDGVTGPHRGLWFAFMSPRERYDYEERPSGDDDAGGGLVAAPGQRLVASSTSVAAGGGRVARTRRGAGRRGAKKRRPAAGGLWTGDDDDEFDVGDGVPKSMHEELLAVLRKAKR